MIGNRRAWAAPAAIILATVLLPPTGAALGGRDLQGLFRFPPLVAIPTAYPRFSWIAVTLVLAPFVALATAWARSPRSDSLSSRSDSRNSDGYWPWWGFAAALWTLCWWAIAWSDSEFLAPVRRYTFFPLWLGFIIATNALVVRRRGTCAMLRAPGRWLGLFGASAVFWWIFEWLNRFTQNWHYLGIADFSAAAYALHATLCFSTVLPAVAAVAEWLDTSTHLTRECERGLALPWLTTPVVGIVLVAIGVMGLIGAGARPWTFYPALWTAPLALALGHAVLSRSGGIPSAIAIGNWRVAGTWASAAMVCGFFWEMWNFRSAAKWIYTVPYADRWHLFEMPLAGYLGYLPFGLECYLVATRVLGSTATLAPTVSTSSIGS